MDQRVRLRLNPRWLGDRARATGTSCGPGTAVWFCKALLLPGQDLKGHFSLLALSVFLHFFISSSSSNSEMQFSYLKTIFSTFKQCPRADDLNEGFLKSCHTPPKRSTTSEEKKTVRRSQRRSFLLNFFLSFSAKHSRVAKLVACFSSN